MHADNQGVAVGSSVVARHIPLVERGIAVVGSGKKFFSFSNISFTGISHG